MRRTVYLSKLGAILAAHVPSEGCPGFPGMVMEEKSVLEYTLSMNSVCDTGILPSAIAITGALWVETVDIVKGARTRLNRCGCLLEGRDGACERLPC